jgi:mRNA interferase MazF
MNVLLEPPQGGLIRPSIIKTNQILTVSKDRLEKKLGLVGEEKMKEVDQALKLSLAL